MDESGGAFTCYSRPLKVVVLTLCGPSYILIDEEEGKNSTIARLEG